MIHWRHVTGSSLCFKKILLKAPWRLRGRGQLGSCRDHPGVDLGLTEEDSSMRGSEGAEGLSRREEEEVVTG